MGTPINFETVLRTEGKEKRIDSKENIFQLQLQGYHLFPLHQPIEITRTKETDEIGTAIIVELTLKEKQTFCTYQLISLSSVN
ncbi:Protein of unknown function [Terribacillus aidingensis]|uniref:DUF2584 domain-containing protein n=1 Tax=Terribacillus aidingensis TaxID=586416 RepID=A0A285NMU1_9BACI|nr:DUF2584 family protein [Terribacillus aidingensis]SNZ10253.1 Protein of unknown function [Terribacillus aidingensis]